MVYRKAKQNLSEMTFDIINYSLLCIVLLLYIYPLYFVIIASISNPNEIFAGRVWLLPRELSFDSYIKIFNYKSIWIGYRNTIIYTVLGTAINLFMTVIGAYPLSRKDFRPGQFLMKMYIFTMFFSGGLIPTFILVKSLGMMDTIWAMVIPSAVSIWNIIITKTYFQTSIPEELKDAASIDGCSNMLFLRKIVIPLSLPILAVMMLFYGVGNWNSYFNGLIYMSDRNKYPLQLFLREILVLTQVSRDITGTDASDIAEQGKIAQTIKFGIIIVSSLPLMVLYPFVQKHFVKGIMIGSIKG